MAAGRRGGPTIFGDINGDGVVNVTDYNDMHTEIGTTLPPAASVESPGQRRLQPGQYRIHQPVRLFDKPAARG